jgi:hypothetical protein
MSAVDSGRDTTSADLLAEIMQQILVNKAGKTADNSFTVTQIIPLSDGIDFADTSAATERGLWFEITNDAGGGTTNSLVAGKISWSVLTEYPTAYGQITDTSGWGVGVMAQGVIGTTVIIATMTSDGS